MPRRACLNEGHNNLGHNFSRDHFFLVPSGGVACLGFSRHLGPNRANRSQYRGIRVGLAQPGRGEFGTAAHSHAGAWTLVGHPHSSPDW